MSGGEHIYLDITSLSFIICAYTVYVCGKQKEKKKRDHHIKLDSSKCGASFISPPSSLSSVALVTISLSFVKPAAEVVN